MNVLRTINTEIVKNKDLKDKLSKGLSKEEILKLTNA